MKKKAYMIGTLLAAALLAGCSSTTSTIEYQPGKIEDPYKLMEAKREYYKEREEAQRRAEEKARLEEQKRLEAEQKAKEKAKLEEQKRLEAEEKAKLEAERKAEEERLKNMTPEEKLKLKMDNAMKRLQEMNQIVDKARAEEISNTESLKKLDSLIQNN